MNQKFTIGFENELIIIDPINQIPIYETEGKLLSPYIISVLSQRHPDLIKKGMIKPELDACQIEIINHGGKNSIDEAIDEMIMLFETVESTVKELGYIISPSVVPQQNFTTISSGGKDYYTNIIETLQDKGVEKSTNVAGLHCNVGSQDYNSILELHHNLSIEVLKNLTNDMFDILGISATRFKHYLNVVDAMNMDYLPKVPKGSELLQEFYLHKDGSPKSSYELVRLKKLDSNILLSELRTPDAGTSIADLYQKMKKTYDFIFNI